MSFRLLSLLLISALLWVVSGPLVHAAPSEDEAKALRIFVLTGQSNALGTLGTTAAEMRHPPVGNHAAEQVGGVPFFWDNRSDGSVDLGHSGGWTWLGPQTGGVYPGNDQHWGPEVGFARMLWNAGYRDFAIVKASRGGGGNGFWHKGSADDHMYQKLVSTVAAAVADLPEGYATYQIAGLLYVQGESNDATEAAAAGTRFAELLADLSDDLTGADPLAGIIGEIAGTGTNRDTTRAEQLALADSRPDIGYAKSIGLSVHNQDGLSVHYNAESQVLLGERMAAEAIAIGKLDRLPLPAWEDLYAWFVADNGVTFDHENAVSRWATLHDGAGQRDLSRRVSGQTFRRTVTAGDGGTRQVMIFDGSNDLWANATTEFGALSGGRSVAVLCRVTGNGDGFLFDGSTGTGKTRAQVRADRWQAGVATSTGGWDGAEPDTAARLIGEWQQHVFTYLPDGSGGTTVTHWVDGERVATKLDPQTSNLGGLIVGANGGSPFRKLAVEIAELAVFRSVLGESEVAELGAAWDDRWGTPTGPPFAATVSQHPREIARFGWHELLEIRIDSDTTGTTALEAVAIQLAPGTREVISRIALIDVGTGTTLAAIDAPATDELQFSASAVALIEGTNRFQISITPKRNGPLGSALDAEVAHLTLSGSQAGNRIPGNADPVGHLTLGLVPLFTDVRSSGEGGVHTYRIPGIVTDRAGVLHSVYDHRYDHAGDLPADVDVGYSRSIDGGASWSASRVIMDYDASAPGSAGNGVGDPCILYDPGNDTLWVAALWSFGNRGYNGSGPGLLPTETGQYVLVKSADGGDTWSEPINITSAVKENPNWRLIFQGPGHGLVMRDGTLVFPSQFRDEAGVVRVCSVFSADGGETWEFGSAVPVSSPQTNENTVCELDDGRLLYSMRTPFGSNGQRAWIHYTPGGETPMRDGTWGNLFRLPSVPDPVCQGSVIQWTSVRRGDPRELILFGNPGSSSSRTNFTLRVSPEGGNSWPVSRLLYPGSAAYSSICILPDRSVGVLFERDNYSRITFARVEEGWLYHSGLDTDNDGIPDNWEILHGSNPLVADGEMDPDGDRVVNYNEYLAGTDPLKPGSAFRVEGLPVHGGYRLEWASVPGRSYAIEQSADLSEWGNVDSSGAVLADGPTTSLIVPIVDDQRFFRVRVQP